MAYVPRERLSAAREAERGEGAPRATEPRGSGGASPEATESFRGTSSPGMIFDN